MTNATTVYTDVDSSSELGQYIQLAYQYQIMGIFNDGTPIRRFKPNQTVTRAEFATILSRVLFGDTYNKDGNDFYARHIQALKDAGILTNTNPSIEELRGYILLMLSRVQTGETENVSNNDSETVENIVNDDLNNENNSEDNSNTSYVPQKIENVYTPNAADIQKYGKELADIYKWAEENGVIPSLDINKANLNLEITREDVAEIMVNFVSNVLGRQPVKSGNANYQDVSSSDSKYIQLAYQYQIMGIDANGNATKKFNPKKNITRTEIATILSRILFGDTQNGAIETLNEAGILNSLNSNITERKRYILTMLYRAQNPTK